MSTTITDPDGAQKTDRKDYLGRLKEVVEYNQGEQYTTRYEYNAAGDLTQVTNALNDITLINYDTLGRKINMDDPDMGYWTYSYDLNGNLTQQVDANLTTTTFTYDVLNRVGTKTYLVHATKVGIIEQPLNVTYTYDNASINNGIGQLYRVANSNNSQITTYNGYDSVGQVKSATKTISGGGAKTTSYLYDLSGKTSQITYPSGLTVLYSYIPGTGLLDSVYDQAALRYYAILSDYEPTGKIGKVEYFNSSNVMKSNTQYTYDPLTTRLTNITTYSVVNGNLQNKSYEYSPAGDIVSIENNITGISYFYDYDGLHRLISETNNAGSATSAEILDYSYELAQIHAVSKINRNGINYNFAYDDNGNNTSGYHLTTSPVTRTIKYNADNMPTQVRMSGSIAATFTYDTGGVRVKKVAGTNTTYYYGDHYELENGTAVNYIFAGSLRIAKKKGSTVEFFHKDHLGSSTVIVTETGAWQQKTEYMPYGTIRDQDTQVGYTGTNYMFTDQERDVEIGLYNYGARLYDPIMGVFVSADSVVPSTSDPQALNRYSYCYNNPLLYVDPTGHFGITEFLVAAVISSISAGAQSDWDFQTMATAAMVGGFSGGVVGSEVAALAGGGIPGGVAGGMAGGATSGGMNAAIYGGNIFEGMVMGASLGGISGLAYGAIDLYYDGSFPIDRVVANGLVGGGVSELAGGNFLDGFYISAGISVGMWAHSNRNILDQKCPKNQAEFEKERNKWTEVEKRKSVWHRQGENGRANTRYLSEDGHTDLIINGETGQRVTDPLNRGSNNIFHPLKHPLLHGVVDVVPYWLWGNCPTDPSTIGSRLYEPRRQRNLGYYKD